jgi:hypothetical protein
MERSLDSLLLQPVSPAVSAIPPGWPPTSATASPDLAAEGGIDAHVEACVRIVLAGLTYNPQRSLVDSFRDGADLTTSELLRMLLSLFATGPSVLLESLPALVTLCIMRVIHGFCPKSAWQDIPREGEWVKDGWNGWMVARWFRCGDVLHFIVNMCPGIASSFSLLGGQPLEAHRALWAPPYDGYNYRPAGLTASESRLLFGVSAAYPSLLASTLFLEQVPFAPDCSWERRPDVPRPARTVDLLSCRLLNELRSGLRGLSASGIPSISGPALIPLQGPVPGAVVSAQVVSVKPAPVLLGPSRLEYEEHVSEANCGLAALLWAFRSLCVDWSHVVYESELLPNGEVGDSFAEAIDQMTSWHGPSDGDVSVEATSGLENWLREMITEGLSTDPLSILLKLLEILPDSFGFIFSGILSLAVGADEPFTSIEASLGAVVDWPYDPRGEAAVLIFDTTRGLVSGDDVTKPLIVTAAAGVSLVIDASAVVVVPASGTALPCRRNLVGVVCRIDSAVEPRHYVALTSRDGRWSRVVDDKATSLMLPDVVRLARQNGFIFFLSPALADTDSFPPSTSLPLSGSAPMLAGRRF